MATVVFAWEGCTLMTVDFSSLFSFLPLSPLLFFLPDKLKRDRKGVIWRMPREKQLQWLGRLGCRQWQGTGLQSRRKYHFLATSSLRPPPSGCSSALSDTTFPWKAEVILPLQGAPQRQASPFPSLGVNIYRKSRVPPRTKHQADWTWLFQVEAKWAQTHRLPV